MIDERRDRVAHIQMRKAYFVCVLSLGEKVICRLLSCLYMEGFFTSSTNMNTESHSNISKQLVVKYFDKEICCLVGQKKRYDL